MLYYRRKILLALIEAFDGHLTAKQLQKYLFLFTRKQEEKAFDFIPYYYGCFSFQANQDIMTLAKLGYLSIIKSENGRRIQICQPNNYLMMLDMFEQQAIKEIKEKKFDLVVIHGWSSLSHLIAIFTCIATNTPYALRGDTNAFDINRKLTLKNKLRNRLLSYIFNKASTLFYIGEENKKFYKSFGVKESQLIKMPFAINNDYFEAFNFDLEEKRINIKEYFVSQIETITVKAFKNAIAKIMA